MKTCARGFTLVELMVAMAIGLVVAAVVVTMFAGSSKTYKIADSVGELQETGRVAMDALQRDAHMVGFDGCNSHNVGGSTLYDNNLAVPTAYASSYGTAATGFSPIAGFESTGAGWNPALPAAIGTPAAPVPGALPTDSDVLIMRVVAGAPLALSAAMASSAADVPLQATTGLTDGVNAIISSCFRANVFNVTAVAGLNLQHAVGANSVANLSGAFQENAVVMRIETHAYFVAPGIRNPATQNSLWLRIDTQPPVEVVENVQRLIVLYGEDTDAVSDFVPNSYRRANSVANWRNVVALQVSLLLRSADDNQNDAITNYVYDGATVVPTDRRARRVYTATIHLRNRTL
jgi:type IV pilus assembly protein PilW